MKSLIGEVPDGWSNAELGDLCEILPGPSGERVRPGGDRFDNVPVVAPRDFRANRLVRGDLTVPLSVAEHLQRYRLVPGDVVCARTGELGRQALVEPEQEGWLVGTSCLRLRAHGLVSGPFLVYYLGHPLVRDWILANSTGSVMRSLNRETLRSLPVVCPPLPEQARIADLLGALDRKISIHVEIGTVTSKFRDSLLPLLVSGEGIRPR